jgi:lipopolysaccharide transport system ATP-binding protein
VRHVDLNLARGAAIGLCGENGAGKSSLLKVLAGTSAPSEGRYRLDGKVASLLELGTGFHQDFSGIENVEMHGVLAGHSRREVRRRMDAILDFAELGDAAQAPVRTYSTGMGMRLGFAAALGFDPDLLILDEVFAVGDMYFQKKCVDRLLEFKRAGKTILFCSHSLYDLRQLCDEALWLDGGEVRAAGESNEVTCAYAAWQREHIVRENQSGVIRGEPDWPDISAVSLRCAHTGEPISQASTGSDLELVIDWHNPRPALRKIQIGATFTRQDQTLCAAAGTHLESPGPRPVELDCERGRAVLSLPDLALLSGRFCVRVYLFCDQGVFRYAERALDHELVVQAGTAEVGLVRINHHWSFPPKHRTAA